MIIEDFSKDKTRSVIKKYLEIKSEDSSIQLIINEKNFGYGGVQKIAFKYAIKNNFDYVINVLISTIKYKFFHKD